MVDGDVFSIFNELSSHIDFESIDGGKKENDN